jgi:ferritin
MMVQFKEEMEHAMKFYNYIQFQGESVELLDIPKPPNKWESPLQAFEETLKHEQHITKCINELVDLAEELKDRATYNFLQWFIDEQVEEEANDREIIDKLKLIGDSKNALFMLDKELASRTYAAEEYTVCDEFASVSTITVPNFI